MAVNVNNLKGRAWEADLIDWRGYRMQSTQDWKRRIKTLDAVYRGDWKSLFTDESMQIDTPYVTNLVQVGMNDKAKLVSESVPVNVCYPEKETTREQSASHLREAAYDTQWDMNHGDSLVPQLSMDLDGTGACFVAVYVDEQTSDYPVYLRIDPRNAYPDILNGQLLDLVTVEEINYRVAAQAFPKLGLDKDPEIKSKRVEIVHYYSKDRCIQAVLVRDKKGQAETTAHIVTEWDPRGVLPIAFAKLDSGDGQFRGNYDQVIGSLQTKNRIVKQLLDYTDEVVYAPKIMKGVLNEDDADGPGTTYRLDPMVPDARVERLGAATGALQIINILSYLTSEERGGISYPESRQGEVSQSIASASFVASTMGSLTSEVRNIQRLIGKVRERLNYISAHYDSEFLDFEKPLIRPISKVNTYTPSKCFGGNFKSRVIYGASAGLDRMTADTRVIQQLGANLISRATGREQIDYVRDPVAEEAKIEMEQTVDIFKQRMLADPAVTTPMIMELIMLQSDGMTLAEAAAALTAKQQAAQAAQPAQPGAPVAPGEAPGPEGVPPTPGQEQQALGAGGAAPAPTFAPPPLENIMVGRNPAGTTTKL